MLLKEELIAHFVAKKIEKPNPFFTKSPLYPKMSYAPSTKLRSVDGNETATVLTNGNVMAFANGGSWRQMMSLEDWKCLAGNILMVPDRSSSVETLIATQSIEPQASAALPEPEPEPVAAVPLPKRPVGSKLRWVHDQETYRIAIVVANGILQVKSVTDGEDDCNDNFRCFRNRLKKTFYTTEEEWRASLPLGGTISVSEVPVKEVFVAGPHVEMAEKLCKRYKIRSGVSENLTLAQQRDSMLESVRDMEAMIATYKQKEEVSELSPFEKRIWDGFVKSIPYYKSKIASIDEMGERHKNKQTFTINRYNQSRQKLIAILADRSYARFSPSSFICPKYKDNGVAIPKGLFCHDEKKFYASLHEMNVLTVDGVPCVNLYYRKKTIPVGHLFAPQIRSSDNAYDSGC